MRKFHMLLLFTKPFAYVAHVCKCKELDYMKVGPLSAAVVDLGPTVLVIFF